MARTKQDPSSSLRPSAPSKIPVPSSKKPFPPATTKYPWDSYQNTIIVNSVENTPQNRLVGVKHYKQQLAQQKTYPRICCDFEEYRRNGVPEAELPSFNDGEEEDKGRQWKWELGIDYTVSPYPPASPSEYDAMIYKATTTNPTAFLAIVRIAERNAEFMDFGSAVRHLPNHPLDQPLPELKPGVFVEDVPHQKNKEEVDMTILFLPGFYADGRHALGYHHIPIPLLSRSMYKNVKNIVFTPCTTRDLETFDLVEYLRDRKGAGVDGMKSVGARGGRWLDADVVEDWDEWNEGFRVVSHVWEKRLQLAKGAEEPEGV